MTRGANIEYNLNESPYIFHRRAFDYVFSSQNHLDKFAARIEQERKTLEKSLSKRFKLQINCYDLAAIKLYQKIELRGFLVKCEYPEGKFTAYTSPEQILMAVLMAQKVGA